MSKYIVRELEVADYNKGYLNLLKNLTDVGTISEEYFNKQFEYLKNRQDSFVRVIEDKMANKVVATGTIYIEYKFIHQVGKVGHIEDLVVDSDYRNKGLGSMIVENLKLLANANGCYKITLSSPESSEQFFSNRGFKVKEKQMALYYYR